MVVTRLFPEAERPPRPASRPVAEIERIGGSMALDFANTVGGTRVRPVEYLTDYGALLSWSVASGALRAADAEALGTTARERPADAGAALEGALVLREAIYRIFDAVARGDAPGADDLRVLNARLATALAGLEVVPEDGGFAWRIPADRSALDAMLDPIARDAAELLASDDLDRVKGCGGEDCAWLFIDESRNRSRRWCSMADCGNRAKQRRHYRRRRRATR